MIYFIQTEDNQYIKIGKADDPAKRLASLQTACRTAAGARVSGGTDDDR